MATEKARRDSVAGTNLQNLEDQLTQADRSSSNALKRCRTLAKIFRDTVTKSGRQDGIWMTATSPSYFLLVLFPNRAVERAERLQWAYMGRDPVSAPSIKLYIQKSEKSFWGHSNFLWPLGICRGLLTDRSGLPCYSAQLPRSD